MTTPTKLRRIVDELPGERAEDPRVRRVGDAAPEDEQISPEEVAAVREARDELAAGAPLVSEDEIKGESGIE